MDNTNQIIDKDIYSPPKAELQDIAENTQTTFYVVSERKFTILFLATLGLYELYWFVTIQHYLI